MYDFFKSTFGPFNQFLPWKKVFQKYLTEKNINKV